MIERLIAMRYVKVHGFELMRSGKTHNDYVVNEGDIEEAVIHHVFDGAPIVFNENQNFKDYRDNDNFEDFVKEKVVGVVLPDTVDFNGFEVTGDVMLQEDFADRTHFDNWCIEWDTDKRCYFNYCSCELFSNEE